MKTAKLAAAAAAAAAAVASFVVAAVIAAPATAATVSPAKVRSPQVAVNVDAATVVAWERLTKGAIAIEARAGDGPLELGRTRRLSARGHGPRVAVGADGTKAVMWHEHGARGVRSIRVAVARPGRGFGRAQLVDRRRANMATVGVAVQPGGRVVAIWRRSSSRLAFALARRNHAFGRARNLATIRQPPAATIPVDPRDGSITIAYGTPVGSAPPANQQAAVRTLGLSATRFSAPAIVSQGAGTTPFDEAHPTMASGPAGVGVAFSQSGETSRLSLVRRNGDGSWAAREDIPLPSYGADVFATALQATLPADGSAVAAWSIDTQSPNGMGATASQIAASIAAPAIGFAAQQALTAPGSRFAPPAVAAAGGEAFVATARVHGPVLLATRAAGASAFAPPATLTERGDGDVLLAAAGTNVLAAYQQGDRLRLIVVR